MSSPTVAAVSDRREHRKDRQSETAATVVLVRERLKHLDIIYQHFSLYFVTACAAKRQNLLASEHIQSAFKAFAASAPNYGAWVGAYIFMPDHFHLFVAIGDEKLSLSDSVKSLKGTLSSVLRREANRFHTGRKDFLITCSVVRSPIHKNGIMCARTPFAPS
jgi:REP element-mobilizing transposase RayT